MFFKALALAALAQITFLNPFAAPQGSVAPLVTASAIAAAPILADETCALPAPVSSTGLEPKPFVDGPYKWNNDSGQTWNTQVPYAIGKCTTTDGRRDWRFELHDTPNDHGLSDPSTKRRAEIGATASYEKFHNHTTYWLAFSVMEHWSCPSLCHTELRIAQPLHWPSGASPAVGLTVINLSGKIYLRVTTCGDDHTNHVRAQVPFTLDVPHDFVIKVTPDGTNGLLNVWMDKNPVVAFKGAVGSNIEDGYTFRVGDYNQLDGNVAVEDVRNIAPFPSTADLSARISAPPIF